MKTQLRKIGSSFGVILPKAVIEKLLVHEGEDLSIIETDQGVTLTPYDPEFEKVMKAYEQGSKRYKNALKELAKR